MPPLLNPKNRTQAAKKILNWGEIQEKDDSVGNSIKFKCLFPVRVYQKEFKNFIYIIPADWACWSAI